MKFDKIENKELLQKERKCLHNECPDCEGSGIKQNGTTCMHMISCPCSKCNPMTM